MANLKKQKRLEETENCGAKNGIKMTKTHP